MKRLQLWQIKIQRFTHKLNLDEENILLILTLIIGVGSGILATSLKHAIHFSLEFFKTDKSPTLTSILIGLAFIVISGALTKFLAPKTAGSGIPTLKIAITAHHGKVPFFDWFMKYITSMLSLSSGMVLGREGPTVAITSGLGSSLGRLFSLSHSKVKSLVAVGAAGGIAAAFNTPMAAVMFTMEEVMGNLTARSLGPIIISSVVASITAKFLDGGESMFSVLQYKFEDPMSLPFYLAVGIVCAIIGPVWVRFLLAYRKRAKAFCGEGSLILMVVPFLFLIAVAYYSPLVMGGGDDIINDALLSKLTDWKVILFLFFVKAVFAALFLSSGISGGIFMPTLFMGAMIGSLVGIGAYEFSGGSFEIGSFALVGMGAYFATVIRAPFTSILIIFELTQDYKIVLPLMIANVTAYVLSQRFTDGSIYEQISEQNGVHLPTKEDNEILDSLTVEESMIRDVKSLEAAMTIREALSVVNHCEITGYPVVKNNKLVGIITVNEIGQAFARSQGACTLEDLCIKNIMHIYPDQSLMVAFHYLKKFRIGRLLVVSREDDFNLVGIITAEDIVNSFGFHIKEDSKYDVIDNYIKQYNESSEDIK